MHSIAYTQMTSHVVKMHLWRFQCWLKDFVVKGLKTLDQLFDIYCKVTSSIMSCLEAHTSFFRLLMNGILDPYVL